MSRRGGNRSPSLAIVAGIMVAVGAAGCGDSDGGPADGAKRIPFKATVVIKKSGYHPREVSVLTGGSVTWINRDPDEPHTAETEPGRYENLPGGEKGSFDTHSLSWGEPYTVVFHKPGTYAYTSSYDFGWKGLVNVIDRAPPPRQADPSP